MAVFTLESLMQPTTKDEWQASIYQVLTLLGTDVTSWKSGSVVPAIVTGVSVVAGALSSSISYLANSGFVRSATGAGLDLKSEGDYNVTRIPSTFAKGNVLVQNVSGGVYALSPGDLIVANPTTGKEYANTQSVTIGAGEVNLSIEVQAVESGSASTSGSGQITQLVTSLNGVSLSNPTALVGQDAESDYDYRRRCLESIGAISPNGPADAYSYVARTATRNADGSAIGVTRVREVKDLSGHLTVYCATATGGVPGTVGDPDTDLGKIQSEFDLLCEPLCVDSMATAATEKVVPVAYQVWMYNDSGMTEADITGKIATKLAQWFSARPIGGDIISANGYVFHSQLQAEIGDEIDEIFRVAVVSPSADVAILGNEVPVLGAITATITQLPRRN
jgi:uncharacterized phage protein gp47/JayE